MGCDIHMLAEKRNKKTKQWEVIGPVFKDSYTASQKSSEPYQGRNYELFAFLADVRNRFEITPIAEQKGWPEDMSKEIKEDLVDYWDSDGHSATWYTVKELREANWEQPIKMGGVVPADVYEYLKAHNEAPKSYSQSISGPKIQTVTEEEWAALPWSEKTNGTRWYVYMCWDSSIREQTSFYEDVIPQLEALGDPEDVRIVFCFDN
jgi:hypothetical protein